MPAQWNQAVSLDGMRFGCEIEMGYPRYDTARALEKVLPFATFSDDGSRLYRVRSRPAGGTWKVKYDGSLYPFSSDEQSEVASPPLTYPDGLTYLRTVGKALADDGAQVSQFCGVHVHVDASSLDAIALRNLLFIAHRNEPLLTDALAIHQERLRYCRPLEADLIERMEMRNPQTVEDVLNAWYGIPNDHYHAIDHRATRYHGVNFHAIREHGTVEFRWYNSVLDPDWLTAYVQLSLALVARSCRQKRANARHKPFAGNPRWSMRVFLINLGLIGDNFQATRRLLMQRLPGNSGCCYPESRSRF